MGVVLIVPSVQKMKNLLPGQVVEAASLVAWLPCVFDSRSVAAISHVHNARSKPMSCSKTQEAAFIIARNMVYVLSLFCIMAFGTIYFAG